MKAKTARRFLNRYKWKLAVARINGTGKGLLRRKAKAIKILLADHK